MADNEVDNSIPEAVSKLQHPNHVQETIQWAFTKDRGMKEDENIKGIFHKQTETYFKSEEELDEREVDLLLGFLTDKFYSMPKIVQHKFEEYLLKGE